jgi:hypothetical protein
VIPHIANSDGVAVDRKEAALVAILAAAAAMIWLVPKTQERR